MKIGNITKPAATTAVDGDRKPAGSSATAKSGATASSAKAAASAQVNLSPEASALSAAAADPSFDSEKVNRIAQAIKDGKFTVNHGAIADKLIANAQELLGRSNSH